MLTSKDIENQLKHIPLHYVPFFFPPVEYGRGVWKGIRAYGYLRERQPHLIPTQKEFVHEFIARTINCFPIEKLMTDYDRYKLGLECRAKRAYYALVREEHCITRMKELYPEYGIDVYYNEEDDWKKGIDVTLIDKETRRVHYVHLFNDSPASWRARREKAKRGKGRDFSNHVDLPFNKNEGKQVGDFHLYSDWQIINFMQKLRTDYKHKGDDWDGKNAS